MVQTTTIISAISPLLPVNKTHLEISNLNFCLFDFERAQVGSQLNTLQYLSALEMKLLPSFIGVILATPKSCM